MKRTTKLITVLLMLLVALIIGEFGIPHVLRSRLAAEAAASLTTIRFIQSAERLYATAYPGIGFTCDLSRLGPPIGSGLPDAEHANLVDNVIAGGIKGGYSYILSDCDKSHYSLKVSPTANGPFGMPHLYTDQTGVIRRNTIRPAGPGDSPI